MASDVPAWQLSRGAYQARAGVHRPYICEISPFQYSRMSNRQKVAYDAKRVREWAASAACADAYCRDVVAAFDRGEVKLGDPRLHPEAESAYRGELLAREKAAAEARFKEYQRENHVRGVDDLRVGDRVFDLMGSRYGVVLKLFKKGARVRYEPPAWLVEMERKAAAGETLTRLERLNLRDAGRGEYTVPAASLQWLSYNDLKGAAESCARVRPARFYEAAPADLQAPQEASA